MSDRIEVTTAALVAAYVANNSLPATELPRLIAEVHTALVRLTASAPPETATQRTNPATIRRSITPEGLVSFEDGRTYQTLRRHLTTRGMTPEEYRAKWGLPADYPMVAAAYAARRSALAHSLGLGTRRRKAAGDA